MSQETVSSITAAAIAAIQAITRSAIGSIHDLVEQQATAASAPQSTGSLGALVNMTGTMPSAEDLDKVAEEAAIAAATSTTEPSPEIGEEIASEAPVNDWSRLSPNDRVRVQMGQAIPTTAADSKPTPNQIISSPLDAAPVESPDTTPNPTNESEDGAGSAAETGNQTTEE